MQVKKFEAKTMKEALEMVKAHLGPEAIILSAKDNSKSYGLMGQKSVEVTAAVSEEILRRKNLAESKLSAVDKTRYQQSSAQAQKKFIEKAARPPQNVTPIRQTTQQRYVDIEEAPVQQASPRGYETQMARARIKSAARQAYHAGLETMTQPRAKENNNEIVALKNEIQNLKSLLDKFKNVPQNFLNLHPGADRGVPFELTGTFAKLVRSGLSEDNVVEILRLAEQNLTPEEIKKPAHLEAWLVQFLLQNLKVTQNRTRGFYHVFVGPAGQGKTSSLVKFASQLVIHDRKKIAIATLDSFKVGAAEQLKIYAQILNVPFAVIKDTNDWHTLDSKLNQFDHVLVDAPGFQLKNADEIRWLSERLPPQKDSGRVIHYVQSLLSKDEGAFEIAERYKVLDFQDTIVTNLDESAQHGLIYNFQKRFQTPLHSFGIGSKMPEDFEAASKERVVDLIFKISRIKKGLAS